MTQTSSDQIERLEALLGRWHTEGWTREEAGSSPERIDATDTYEWLPGGASLSISLTPPLARPGWRAPRSSVSIRIEGNYATLYFGTDGPTAYEADLTETGGVLVWEMWSTGSRFRGSFDAEGGLITGHWELVAGSEWRPWMDITLSKQAS